MSQELPPPRVPVRSANPAANYPSELRARNRRVLFVVAALVFALACLPLIVRVFFTPPTPVIHRTARELLPPEAAKTDLVVLYASPGPWVEAVASVLPALPGAAQEVFATAPATVEGVLLDDAQRFGQLWVQIFGRDDRPPGWRGVGRATFFLVDIGDPAGPGGQRAISPRALGDVVHYYGWSVLEQQLGERFRHVPDWYRAVVGEMMAVAVVPGVEAHAWDAYGASRETFGPANESSFMRDFYGPRSEQNHAIATLLASRLLRSKRTPDFVRLVHEGETQETAYRAVGEAAMETMLKQIDQEHLARRAAPGGEADESPDRADGG